MTLKFEDKTNIENYDGIALLYEGKVASSNKKDFDELVSSFCKRKKVSKTSVLGESIQVFFKKTPDEVIISEHRLIDKFRLSNTREVSFRLFLNELSKL